MATCSHSNCDRDFSFIAQHWRYNPSHRPDITDEQREIIKGIMLGDGSIEGEVNPSLRLTNTTKPFLDWLSQKLEPIPCSIEDRGIRSKGQSRVYRLNTPTHPDLQEFEDWYSSGRRRFPKDLELTPMVLKMWYVCDGSYATKSGAKRACITAANENDRTEFVQSLFEDIGLTVKWYADDYIYLNEKESKNFFDYIGEPIPGFEHKWPCA